jgi:hydrogenase expression/formation protein HypC
MCLAIPGKIMSISGKDPLERTGKIDFGGILKQASLAYVPEAKVGDYVIVHVGFALSRLDEEEANKVFEYLKEMEDLDELKAGDAAPQGRPASEAPGLGDASGAANPGKLDTLRRPPATDTPPGK